MKIDKAIEILTAIKDKDPELYMDDEQDALQLGIEALKRVQLQHDPGGVITPDLLPGETKD